MAFGTTWGTTLSFRPSPSLRVRFEPQYSRTYSLAQYVTTVLDADASSTYGARYVFSTLDRNVLSLVTRLDWTFTPRLSLQLYLQPFVDSGKFRDFKEFDRPNSFAFDVYGRDRGSISRSPGGVYTVRLAVTGMPKEELARTVKKLQDESVVRFIGPKPTE